MDKSVGRREGSTRTAAASSRLTFQNGLIPVQLRDISHTLKIDSLTNDKELSEPGERAREEDQRRDVDDGTKAREETRLTSG